MIFPSHASSSRMHLVGVPSIPAFRGMWSFFLSSIQEFFAMFHLSCFPSLLDNSLYNENNYCAMCGPRTAHCKLSLNNFLESFECPWWALGHTILRCLSYLLVRIYMRIVYTDVSVPRRYGQFGLLLRILLCQHSFPIPPRKECRFRYRLFCHAYRRYQSRNRNCHSIWRKPGYWSKVIWCRNRLPFPIHRFLRPRQKQSTYLWVHERGWYWLGFLGQTQRLGGRYNSEELKSSPESTSTAALRHWSTIYIQCLDTGRIVPWGTFLTY